MVLKADEQIDETDRFEDNHSKRKATRKGTAAIMSELFRSRNSPERTVADVTEGIIERNRVINAFANSRQPSVSSALPHALDSPANRHKTFTQDTALTCKSSPD